MWLVDGVEGDRFAIVTKSHHCLVDGVSGVDITTVLFDAAPDPEPPAAARRPGSRSPSPATPRCSPRRWSSARPARPRSSAAPGPCSALRAGSRGRRSTALEAAGAFARTGLGAPHSPFNVEIGPYRRFATVQADSPS